MEQIEEIKQTSKDVKIYEPSVVYIYNVAREGNIRFGRNTFEHQETVNHLRFLSYLLYEYIKNSVDKNKDQENVKPKKYEDILQETLVYFKISDAINEMKCLKNISLSSLQLVIIDDLETGYPLDFLDFVPNNVKFRLKFPMTRGCVKHLRKNIRLSVRCKYNEDSLCHGDVYSYINRARLYQYEERETNYYKHIDYYRGNSKKQIAVHGSRVNFVPSIMNMYPKQEEGNDININYIGYNSMIYIGIHDIETNVAIITRTSLENMIEPHRRRLWDLSRLVCTAKLDVDD